MQGAENLASDQTPENPDKEGWKEEERRVMSHGDGGGGVVNSDRSRGQEAGTLGHWADRSTRSSCVSGALQSSKDGESPLRNMQNRTCTPSCTRGR